MDKYEYKVRADEIQELISQKEYAMAAEIADTIDWRRVKSVMMLCTISDLYKINRRYEDARDMLLLAYERRPGGRTICYSLCELSIKMGEFVQAIEYYKEFVQVAPKDSGRYILQYKLYEAQEVSLEERIAVLEELKKHDYREKWAYELAYLYHRIGLETRCVEECDELILWFGEGKYVNKAMELKMLHQPLTEEQQLKYDNRFVAPVEAPPVEEASYGDAAIQEQEADAAMENMAQQMPEYNQVINEQLMKTQVYEPVRFVREAAENAVAEVELNAVEESYPGYERNTAEESYPAYESKPVGESYPAYESKPVEESYPAYESKPVEESYAAYESKPVGESYPAYESKPVEKSYPVYENNAGTEGTNTDDEEMEIHVKTVDVGQYNTINLQAEIAAGLREILEEEKPSSLLEDPITRSIMSPMLDTNTEVPDYSQINEVKEETEVFFGETGELADLQQETAQPGEETVAEEIKAEEAITEDTATAADVAEDTATAEGVADVTAELVMEQLRQEINRDDRKEQGKGINVEPPKELAGVLAQESDGQISLVMPESESIEKQITGQMSIEDVLAEWERLKKENQEKREAEVRQHVLQQTGAMFTEFEASVRDGLLEQLEREKEVEEPETVEEPEMIEEEEAAEDPEIIEEAEAAEEPEAIGKAEAVEETEAIEAAEAAEDPEIIEEAEAAEEPEIIEEAEAAEAHETVVEADVIEETDEVEELEEIAEDVEEPIEEALAEEPASEPPASMEEPVLTEAPASTEEPVSTEAPVVREVVREKAKVRALTNEERELFEPYIQSRSAREQLVKALDNISMAAYTGNIIITGAEGMDTLTLAKNMIREIQTADSNFSGKVAKISGAALNNKDVAQNIEKLKNGALIISKASGMNKDTVKALHKSLQQETLGIIIVLEDTKKAMDRFLAGNEQLRECFTARMDVEALSNDALVSLGKQYAREREYAIDDFGVLALHTRIEELQTIDHAVTVTEVQEMVEQAIRKVNRKTIGHFFDVLLAKRYDAEDMIILSEKDFIG